MITLLIVYPIVHIVCGVLAYGLTFGYFQGYFHRSADERRIGDIVFSVFMGCFGPIGLFVASFLALMDGWHGLKWK